jgi:rod shape determining protein RodA
MLSKILKFDLILFFGILTLSIFGLLTMSTFTAGDGYMIRQSIWIILGVSIFVLVSRFDYAFLKDTRSVLVFYILTNLVLASTLVFGSAIKGSKAWLDFGMFSLQPADFAKIALIVLLAKYFTKRHIEIKNIRHIIVSFIYTLIPVAVTLKQPDFGSAMVLLAIWFVMILMSGLSKKHFFSMLATAVIIFALLWVNVFKPYQKDRLLNFIDPLRDVRGSGYNVYQSQIAIGSGGLTGKGIGYGTQSRLNFLPEHETDFIFSAYSEEWGFIGVVLLLSVVTLLLVRIIYIASKLKENFFVLICVGAFGWIFTHSVINIGMNIGVLPVTGIPLPFMSYGGSHFISTSFLLGLVSSFAIRSFNYKKDYKNEFLGLE